MVKDFNWREPDYDAVLKERSEWLLRLRADPDLVRPLEEFYRTHPVEFITDWGMTFDPRNIEIGLPTTIPFVLFKRQEEFIDWLLARWQSREDGLVEKSRDMGVSWLCVAFAVWMWKFHAGAVVGFGSRKEEYVDKIGDPKCLFWKIRQYINLLPKEFRPTLWDAQRYSPHMRAINPDNEAAIVGEAGDNIGRGNRTSIYLVDEAAFCEHQKAIDAALSQTTNCKIDVSSVNGPGNEFYNKRHSGKVKVFVFDWREDPRKDKKWYAVQVGKLDPTIVASEIDRDYEASIGDAWISGELVKNAMARGPANVHAMGGLRVGVDVARFGDDKTVISFRRGRVLLKQVVRGKLDVVQVASLTKAEIEAYKERPEQIAVDTIGIGAGVADILRGWFPDYKVDGKLVKCVVDVNSSIRLDDGENYNMRALMAREVKEWLKGASMPNDPELKSDCTAMRYTFKGGALLIESKLDAKDRGIKSPDRFDSLALTFAYPTIVSHRPKTRVPTMGIPRDSVVGI